MRKTKTYDEEFKRQAINLCKTSSKKISHIARDLGVANSTLSDWLKNSREDELGKTLTSSEVLKFKRELTEVKLERDILKKAVAIFSKE